MQKKANTPSPLALAFFYWYCHPDFREEIEGDLMERFQMYLREYGYNKANRLFVKEVIFLFRPSIVGNIYHLTHINAMEITNQNKRLFTIVTIALGILSIPLIAMIFTTEVNWKIFDFIIAGVLLLGTGLMFEWILRKVKSAKQRFLLLISLFAALILIWAELAVGIFGTPFAGT
ncbi:hypothetical protein BXY82_1062 [Gelidibacter sediminis]|uniref:Uncharacterized protein n=1 Tax=Gelidibacter sediminis TaxID=1608710 RepID=A0A4V3F9C0_9FLAO|nr:permease prefix domain 2-containing transporter [Gelidibacter sediminis]TDU43646.1 hypothetical protein BXY82_1062 [Gelidibacter sediminis]